MVQEAAEPQAPQDAKPQVAKAPAPQVAKDVAPQSASLLAGSISIRQVATAVKPEVHKLQAEVKPLTQEDLERYWQETARELRLEDLLSQAKVRLGEHMGRITIDAQTTWFSDEFKPHKISVMESLRKKTGMPMLEAKVNPMYVSQEEVLYSPADKYNAMLKTNPNLIGMRKLFPQIDY